jgi:PiT family inorganic phosphate transporter
MAGAWLLTLPAAAVVGAAAEALAHVIGGSWGVVVALVILAGIAGWIYLRSRATKVDHKNVNEKWAGTVNPLAEPAIAGGGAADAPVPGQRGASRDRPVSRTHQPRDH